MLSMTLLAPENFIETPRSPKGRQSAPSPKPGDMRTYLQQELLRRCRANQNYSLRSFAKFLGLESSTLSKLLNGKRKITPATFTKVANRLALTPTQIEDLSAPLKPQASSSQAEAISDYRQITLDHFQVISDWYHYAILELTQTTSFQPNAKWVARTLGITVSEVNIAVERLTRIGFLKITESGQWIDESGAVTTLSGSTLNDFTATAFRKLQHQILELAARALEEVPIEMRDQSSMTMAIDSRKLSEAKEKIKRFRRELCRFLKGDGKRDHVYHLGISLYPVTDLKQTAHSIRSKMEN